MKPHPHPEPGRQFLMRVVAGDQRGVIARLDPGGVAPVLLKIALKGRRLFRRFRPGAEKARHVPVEIDQLFRLGLPLL